MIEISSTGVRKEVRKVTNVQLISNDVHQPPFLPIPNIVYKGDPSSVLLTIPSKVIMIQDVRCYYICKVGEIGDLEIREAYQWLCENSILREQNKILERKGLMCALHFPQVF